MSRIRSLAPIVLLAMLCRAAPSPAVTHIPAGNKLEIGAIARADTVYVLRLRPEAIPYCEWDFPDALRFTHCHPVTAEFPAPDAQWCRDLGDLLAHSEMGAWDGRCDYLPQAIVRFVEGDRVSDLVVLTGVCDPSRLGLVLIVPGSAMEYRELRTGREDFRDMMAYALTPDETVPVVGRDAPLSTGSDPVHPEEGEFVYYDQEPVPVTRIEPTYPEFAREAQIRGKVTLHVLVNTEGRVRDIRVIHGVTGLNEAAVDAVKRWVFRPATSGGKPVAVWVEIPIDF